MSLLNLCENSCISFQNFFVEDYWNKLPKQWQSVLSIMDTEELAGLLSAKHCQRFILFTVKKNRVDIIAKTDKDISTLFLQTFQPNETKLLQDGPWGEKIQTGTNEVDPC